MKKLKVLMHVNQNERWKVALGNAENLLKISGENGADVIILGNGESVVKYEEPELHNAMRSLSEKGVSFFACRNSMRKMKEDGLISIGEEQLPGFVQVVPAGIVAIIEKQNEGYAYVKP